MERTNDNAVAKAIADFLEKTPERWFTTEEMVAIVETVTRAAVRETLKQLGFPEAEPTKEKED